MPGLRRPVSLPFVLAGLLLVTAAAYAPGLRGDFQFDDLHTVEFNPSIRRLGSLAALASPADMASGKRVLTDLTFALDYRLAGDDPLLFHATNLAIHLGTVLLVFFFTRRMLGLSGAGPPFLALAVTGSFALHPLQTQAVAYLSQRAESLASGLYLASLLLLLRTERRGRSRRGLGLYLASFVLFALGLSAKIVVVTLPLAYLLVPLLATADARARWASTRTRVALATPFILYGTLAGWLMIAGMNGDHAGFHVPSLPPGRYFLTQLHVLPTYLRLLLWPAGQNVDWDFPLSGGLADPVTVGCAVLAVLLAVVLGMLWRHARAGDGPAARAGRAVVFGALWFVVLLAPTSSFVPLADVLMEHRLYLASWGVFFAVSVTADLALRRLSPPGRTRFAVVASTAVCAALAVATARRVELWSSTRLLWSDAVAKSPDKARPHLGLGNAYRSAGQHERALEEYRAALARAAHDPGWLRADIASKMAAVHLAQGQPGQAIAEVESGLAAAPDDADLLGLLAMAHLQSRAWAQAEQAAEQSVRKARQPAASLRTLGLVRLQMGHPAAAIAPLQLAVEAEPDEPQGRLLLGSAYRSEGRLREACATVAEIRRPPAGLRALVDQALADCPPR